MAILTQSQSSLLTVYSWAQSAQKQVVPAIEKTKTVAVQGFSSFVALLDRYPPLKAFVIALVLFASVPLSIFAGFALTSGAIVFGTAATGFAVVQGGLLAFGGFFLFWFLLGALFFAGLASFWFSAGYFGLSAAKKLAA